MCAIDFTASNGPIYSSSSLHYLSNYMNCYERAIKSVGDIILSYTENPIVPLFGFGGVYKDNQISHCFPLNGNDFNSNALGMQGLLGIYRKALT